ncbi:hypothetical protein MYSTI_02048 [Myxococcus stipitatus DSM 14675]|uniref:Uncharacterized protein n=1 Tax=Myxococcus stipitatus (strain DSM 14675 / JCM 12634 / Mx s8) TaxID=1278073 RepID=L7U735_MYXSD|nr:hypothetical protein [Myxococcus stipitatus]AGC43377.1 hypothetical protein MYSTI_02048 [Myxococcus stipitatus DSM 14675]
MDELLKKLHAKAGTDLLSLLSRKLSGSELGSLLLAVFDERVKGMTAANLLQAHQQNRFVHPATLDVLHFKSKELELLTRLAERGFEPLELSPVSALGTSSVLGTVSQKKVLSATRGTEVLSDATNVMALHYAMGRKNGTRTAPLVKFCATPRHLRTPAFTTPGFTPHFAVACLVTAGRDSGDFAFEKAAFTDHLQSQRQLLKDLFQVELKSIKLQQRRGSPSAEALFTALHDHLRPHFSVQADTTPAENNYYQGVQYKGVIEVAGKDIELIDGGFVDWTQQLLANKKERFLISGLGLEYLTRLVPPQTSHPRR